MLEFANTHDLLEVESAQCIEQLDTAPAWVKQSLSVAPYVVVRRAARSQDLIAIGVRGNSRDQRWPSFIRAERVRSVLSPFELCLWNRIRPSRLETIPALRNLQRLEETWRDLEYKWGPGGSVGFELASGHTAATAGSDLDIVLFAPQHFDREYARCLLSSVREISTSIDVLVEAPGCGFLLAEYAIQGDAAVLLRCADGPRFAADPWRAKVTHVSPAKGTLVEQRGATM